MWWKRLNKSGSEFFSNFFSLIELWTLILGSIEPALPLENLDLQYSPFLSDFQGISDKLICPRDCKIVIQFIGVFHKLRYAIRGGGQLFC